MLLHARTFGMIGFQKQLTVQDTMAYFFNYLKGRHFTLV